jgi:integrase
MRRRGPVWMVKYRAPDQNGVERQYHRLLGPEWEGAGPPPTGFFNKRLANEALQAILTDARRGALELARTGISFAQAADDWMEWGIHQRGWKPSTITDRRSCLRRHLLPVFGSLRVEQISSKRIERWKHEFLRETGQRRQCAKLLALMSSIFERARQLHGLPKNPVADVDRVRIAYDPTRYDFYSPEEVYALARATTSEQDAAIFLTAAFAGLRRGELAALRWGQVDFAKASIRVEASYSHREVTTTKGGRGRAVPMVDELGHVLARLGQRGYLCGRDDLVFPGEAGGHMDASALRRRYVLARDAAGLRPLRFHDLRHTFGSLAINRASLVQIQAWMGHADSRTTMRYLHHKSQEAEAVLLAGAFRPAAQPAEPLFA